MDKAIHDCEIVTSFCLIDDYTLDYDHSWVKLCMSSRHSSTLGLCVNYWKFSAVTQCGYIIKLYIFGEVHNNFDLKKLT